MTEEMEALKERVINGNQKLNEAWEKICQIDHSSQRWKDELEKWYQANEKLSTFCFNLQGLGYRDCLYLIEGEDLASRSKEEIAEVMKKVEKGAYSKLGSKIKTKKCLEGQVCLVCPSDISYWETEFDSLGRESR